MKDTVHVAHGRFPPPLEEVEYRASDIELLSNLSGIVPVDAVQRDEAREA
jgi:hypothetical protein